MSDDVQATLPLPAEPPQEPVNTPVQSVEPLSPIPTPEPLNDSIPEPHTEQINEQGTENKPQESIENVQTSESQQQPSQSQPNTLQPTSAEQASQIERPLNDAIVVPGGLSSKASTTTSSTAPLPTNLEPQAQEQIVEKVIEKPIPRELNEEEKSILYNTRLKTLGVRAIEAKRNRLQKNLDAIVTKLKESEFITNDQVQQLCNVADSTATKYLKILEQQGVILPIGRKGRGLRWRLKAAI